MAIAQPLYGRVVLELSSFVLESSSQTLVFSASCPDGFLVALKVAVKVQFFEEGEVMILALLGEVLLTDDSIPGTL